jgi:gliding motility-associated-like protein
MKKALLTLISTIALVNTLFSQYCPFLGPDQFLPCGVTSTTLTADLSQCGPGGANPNQTTNYGVTQIPYVSQTNTGTLVNLSDDSQAGPFNIGFTFCYFGQTYTQFYIGSNGWISFSAGQSTTFTSTPIPNVAVTTPKNCIMGPWQDWNPGIGGQIRYQVQGTAPCRKLVVSWVNVPMFSCTNLLGTFHIVIYESTNVIENHIQNKPNCLQWAGGTAVQGIHNLPGTTAISVPGRNSSQWTAQNDARRWTPSGPVVTPTLTWFQVGNPNPIGTGPTITVTPPPAGANYTCQFVYPICNTGWSNCNLAGGGLGPDTVFVQPGPPQLPNPTVVFQDPLCNGDCNGTIDVTPNGGTGVITISWTTPNNGFNLTSLCAGNYNYNLIDAAGCTYNGSVTLNNPPVVIVSTITGSDTVCISSNNELYSVVNQPGYTYIWQTIGNITSGQNTNTITVDWSSQPSGFIPGSVQVTAYNQNNCPSLPSVFDLTVFSVSPLITQIGPFCTYDECELLTAQPIGGLFTINGNNNTQFCPQSNSSFDTVVYTYVQSGCIFYDTASFVVNPQPNILSISPDNSFLELCEGDSVQIDFSIQSTLNGIVSWNINNQQINSISSISTTWNSFGTFIIDAFVTTPEGCVSPEISTSLTIQECPNTLIYIPNSFTPDGDEHNNKWLPVFTSGFDPFDVDIFVFNRWGELVWESHNVSFGWDGTYQGTMCPVGVYVYKITYGNVKNDSRSIIIGHLTLLK